MLAGVSTDYDPKVFQRYIYLDTRHNGSYYNNNVDLWVGADSGDLILKFV